MKWLASFFGGANPWLWIAAAALLASLTAWGGLGWYGKATAERDLDAYQLAAARVITDRLEENQRLSDANARRGAEISAAYQEGKRATEQKFAPELADLADLRARFAGVGLPEQPAPADPGSVSGTPGTAGGSYAGACTDRPGAIVAAAESVAAALKACENNARQLSSLQAWVREVCLVRPEWNH